MFTNNIATIARMTPTPHIIGSPPTAPAIAITIPAIAPSGRIVGAFLSKLSKDFRELSFNLTALSHSTNL